MNRSSVVQVYRLPASLRPARGFPTLRLLQKLRPRSRPSPAVAASPFRTGQTIRVPVFRFSTSVSLGGRLYPGRYRRRVSESRTRLGHVSRAQQWG